MSQGKLTGRQSRDRHHLSLRSGLLGALTAVLVFFRKLVSDAEFEKHGRKLIGLVIVLVVVVPIMALLSMNDTRTADA